MRVRQVVIKPSDQNRTSAIIWKSAITEYIKITNKGIILRAFIPLQKHICIDNIELPFTCILLHGKCPTKQKKFDYFCQLLFRTTKGIINYSEKNILSFVQI